LPKLILGKTSHKIVSLSSMVRKKMMTLCMDKLD
jgi:hypothetical protein